MAGSKGLLQHLLTQIVRNRVCVCVLAQESSEQSVCVCVCSLRTARNRVCVCARSEELGTKCVCVCVFAQDCSERSVCVCASAEHNTTQHNSTQHNSRLYKMSLPIHYTCETEESVVPEGHTATPGGGGPAPQVPNLPLSRAPGPCAHMQDPLMTQDS